MTYKSKKKFKVVIKTFFLNENEYNIYRLHAYVFFQEDKSKSCTRQPWCHSKAHECVNDNKYTMLHSYIQYYLAGKIMKYLTCWNINKNKYG